MPTKKTTEPESLNLHLSPLPNDVVYFIYDRGIKSERVIRIDITVRSIVSTNFTPQVKTTYILESGIERDRSEVFPTREALIQSLY